MLALRRGVVLDAGPADERFQRLEVDVDARRRPALADVSLVGACAVADEVVVNVQALNLGLDSGGFDLVHVNLSRGLAGWGEPGARAMKLNYTSLQHAVRAVEGEGRGEGDRPARPLRSAVAVLALHGQLAPVAWSAGRAAPGARIGYVQTAGGALPGGLSETVRELRARGLLAGHLTAGPAFGGDAEAITVAGALWHGLRVLGWDAALCGPGPGLLGTGSALGHGGLAALDSAHVALALGCRALVVPRMSSADPRPRHLGLSHHTRTVLELLLRPAVVAVPEGGRERFARLGRRHELRGGMANLDGYRASGLPGRTMGRDLDEDPLFFAAALAGGDVLAGMIRGR